MADIILVEAGDGLKLVDAEGATLVHTTGAESIAGVKTFTSAPVVPDASFTVAKISGLGSGATATIPTTSAALKGDGAGNAVTSKITLTTPATGATITIVDGKTFTVSKTLSLTGTDSTVMTFPSTSATIARTDAANTFTGHQTIEGVTSTGATGAGKFVFDSTPTLITPVLGVATATSVNKVAITAPASSATLTIANGKTLTVSNILTLAGTDSTTMTFPSTSATIARTDAANTFTGHQTVEGVTSTGATGTGAFVFATSPTLITPTIGIATATSVNKLTITAPASSATLTIADGKTLTVSNTLTLAGTNGTTLTFPSTSATIARTDAANTFTGVQTMTSPAVTTPVLTGSVTGTYTLTAPTISGAISSDSKVLAATATYTSTVTPATLTGFSWTVVPGIYIFEVNLPATMTTVGGLTVSFLLTTAVLTSIQYQSYAATATDNSTAVSTQGTTVTSGTKVFDSKTDAYASVAIRGSMVVGTGGSFAWQACQNTSAGGGDASAVLLGAYSKMTRVS